MSIKSIIATLAITATISSAERMRLEDLINLQTQMVNELDLEHDEPEVDQRGDLQHHTYNHFDSEHDEPEVDTRGDQQHDNELTWGITHDIKGNMQCPEGSQRIGCCKCVADDHKAVKHDAAIVMPSIHGKPDLDQKDKASPKPKITGKMSNDPSSAAFESGAFRGSMYGNKQFDDIVGDRHDGRVKEDRTSDDRRQGDDRSGDDRRQGDDRSGDDRRQGDDRSGDDRRQDDRSQDDRRSDSDDRRQGDDRRQDDRQQADRKQDDRRQDDRRSDDRKQDDRRQDDRKQQKESGPYDHLGGAEGPQDQKHHKFSMHTTEEQARSHHQPIHEGPRHREVQTERDQKVEKKDERSSQDKQQSQEEADNSKKCPHGFEYESKTRTDQAPFKVEACRMPVSYELHGEYDHACHDCHYSYGRWFERCAEHFVRNGAATCTPHCPEGMILENWHQGDAEKNNHVCRIMEF